MLKKLNILTHYYPQIKNQLLLTTHVSVTFTCDRTKMQHFYWPHVYQPRVYQPRVYQPHVHQLYVHQPHVHQPRVHQPRVCQPYNYWRYANDQRIDDHSIDNRYEIDQHEINQHEIDQPEIDQPEINQHVIDQFEIDRLITRNKNLQKEVDVKIQTMNKHDKHKECEDLKKQTKNLMLRARILFEKQTNIRTIRDNHRKIQEHDKFVQFEMMIIIEELQKLSHKMQMHIWRQELSKYEWGKNLCNHMNQEHAKSLCQNIQKFLHHVCDNNCENKNKDVNAAFTHVQVDLCRRAWVQIMFFNEKPPKPDPILCYQHRAMQKTVFMLLVKQNQLEASILKHKLNLTMKFNVYEIPTDWIQNPQSYDCDTLKTLDIYLKTLERWLKSMSKEKRKLLKSQPVKSVETSIDASVEASVEVSVEASFEASVEASFEVSTKTSFDESKIGEFANDEIDGLKFLNSLRKNNHKRKSQVVLTQPERKMQKKSLKRKHKSRKQYRKLHRD